LGFFSTPTHKKLYSLDYKRKETASRSLQPFLHHKENYQMSKKGETCEQDRGKPQPRKKKEREDARKKKKLDRVERQKSR
jgi:hypothetical protein